MRYEIYAFLRPDILDQQGQAVATALVNLGFTSVVKCRIGKLFELDYDGDDIEIIAKYISNEVMENYIIKKIDDEDK
jgi:phosphoribosylformylglycinamidine synthase PurS subunit